MQRTLLKTLCGIEIYVTSKGKFEATIAHRARSLSNLSKIEALIRDHAAVGVKIIELSTHEVMNARYHFPFGTKRTAEVIDVEEATSRWGSDEATKYRTREGVLPYIYSSDGYWYIEDQALLSELDGLAHGYHQYMKELEVKLEALLQRMTLLSPESFREAMEKSQESSGAAPD